MEFSNAVEFELNHIRRRYNPEYDIPPGPEITWAEYWLMMAIRELENRVSELEEFRAVDVEIEERDNCLHNLDKATERLGSRVKLEKEA